MKAKQAKYVQEGVTIQVAQTSRQDVTLKVGSTSDPVTITADAPLLRTEGLGSSPISQKPCSVNLLPELLA